eukprot:TRINITY_DN20312_c0_g2_i1.p1 TRINITY_DN20312_c0_g2~~TRINITY_DN20312_c0_g2_i1.p1  ORF type:complete len:494 (-),score=70.41 TRINITY_DN20312_c0_g2_i1:86-1567(-)
MAAARATEPDHVGDVAACSGGSTDPMSYTLVPEGETVRPVGSVSEPNDAACHEDSLSTHSSKELSSPVSSSTDDQDEEVLHHFQRMQLYRPKELCRRFRSRGYRTMEEIAPLDVRTFQECMQMGLGDADKLLRGLQRYREGTFGSYYQLPLESIVQRSPAAASSGLRVRSDSSGDGAPNSAHISTPLAAALASQGPERRSTRRGFRRRRSGETAVAAAAAIADVAQPTPPTQRAGKMSMLEFVWLGSCWSGVVVSAIVTVAVRCLWGGPVKSSSRRGRRIDALLQYIFFQGLATCATSMPILSLAHLVLGLVRPVRSVACGTVGGGLSAASAAAAFCLSTCGDCFDGTAEVLLPNRTQKRIVDIVEGDLVLSFNKGVFRVKKVLSRMSSDESPAMSRIRFRLPSGELGSISTTGGHPLWVSDRGWCVAQEIKADDVLVHHTGAAARVVAIEPHRCEGSPLNLVVDGPGTFFVNNILVHTNMKGLAQCKDGCAG